MSEQEEVNLVQMWLNLDPRRWVAGALAGLFAGVIMMIFAILLSRASGGDALFPLKVPALPILGNAATAYDAPTSVLIVGIVVHELLAMLSGIVFAHFTGTNRMSALLGMGFTWAAFSWVFWQNLFFPSFWDVYSAQLPPGPAFFILLVFGFSLSSVAVFDRMLRGNG